MPQEVVAQEQTVQKRVVVPAKTLTFYFPPDSSDIALRQLREFFSTESDVCARAQMIADILNTNKDKLQSEFKDIDEVIKLYNNLSLDIFSVSSGFFRKYLNGDKKAGVENSDKKPNEENKEPSVEDWIGAICEVINSRAYQRRLELLRAATLNNPNWDKKVADILKSKTLLKKPEAKKVVEAKKAKEIRKSKEVAAKEDGEVRKILKNDFATPVQRILRMKMLFGEIKKKYAERTNANKETLEETRVKLHEETRRKLGELELLFEAHTQHLNNSMGNVQAGEELVQDNRRQAKLIPTSVVKSIAEPGNSVKSNLLSELLAKDSKDNPLSLPIILNELKKIKDPIQQLNELEWAFGGIRPASTPGERVHLFRKDLLYTNAQLKQIALLKAAYLAVVANTPREADGKFEQYLETNYPQTGKARDGGLLAFNITCVSWFVKTEGKTTSMKQLQTLKAGIGRISADPEHKKTVTAQIAAYGRVFSSFS